MRTDDRQFSFLDLLNVLSFCIGVLNLQENVSQSDVQDAEQTLSKKFEKMLEDIHSHLSVQDTKLNMIMEALDHEKDMRSYPRGQG